MWLDGMKIEILFILWTSYSQSIVKSCTFLRK